MWDPKRNDEQQFDFLDMISILGFAMQIANYSQNSKQSSNDDLMKEMREQDRRYLQKIVEQNERIISLLEE